MQSAGPAPSTTRAGRGAARQGIAAAGGRRDRNRDPGTLQIHLVADGVLRALPWLAKKEIPEDGTSPPGLHRYLVDGTACLTLGARRVHKHLEERTRELWLALLWMNHPG